MFEKAQHDHSAKTYFNIRAKGIEARGYEDAKGFVVTAGSGMVTEETNSIHAYLTALRRDLVEQAVVELRGDRFVFLDNYTFASPSTAAGVLQGRTANGRADWKLDDGTTLREVQNSAAEEATDVNSQKNGADSHV